MKLFSAVALAAPVTLFALLAAGSVSAQLTMPGQTPGGAAAPGPAAAPAPQAPPQGAPQGMQGPDPMTPEFRDCVRKTKEAMEAKKQEDLPAILGCLSGETRRQESRLAASVTKATKSLTATEKKQLEEANTAWRRFRDANCAFYADPKGPAPANLENADCMLNLTVGRAQEMEQVAQQAGRRDSAKGAKK